MLFFEALRAPRSATKPTAIVQICKIFISVGQATGLSHTGGSAVPVGISASDTSREPVLRDVRGRRMGPWTDRTRYGSAWPPSYCRLHNRVSGPEIVKFEGLDGPSSYRKTHWKGWGAKHPTFSNGFRGRGGPLRPQHRRFPARKLDCVTLRKSFVIDLT